MRHKKRSRRLGRQTGHRLSLLRNLTVSLFKEREKNEGQITTTLIRAKELVRCAEKMITLAKKGDLHVRRQALSWMRDKDTTKYLFDTIGPKFKERNGKEWTGGYTRIVKLGFRQGDGAPMAIVELITGG